MMQPLPLLLDHAHGDKQNVSTALRKSKTKRLHHTLSFQKNNHFLLLYAFTAPFSRSSKNYLAYSLIF